MIPRVAYFLTLALVSAFLVVCTDARSWDLAVAIGHRIDFYNRNGEKTGSSEIEDAVSLTSLAYDSKTGTMYIGDAGSTNISIYRDNLNEQKPKLDSIWKPNEHSYVSAVVFDPVDETLFWIDASKDLLMKMKLDENANQPIVLHNLTDFIPWGMAIDICNRYIYWTNVDRNKHSIERSKFDGSERRVIVQSNLYKPHGVAIDYESGKLYWTNFEVGIHYSIERSNLDGTERETFFRGSHQSPYYIAVDREAVYWSDHNANAIWKVDKNGERDWKTKLISYSEPRLNYEINSIITRENIGEFGCKVIVEKQENADTPLPELHDNPTTSSENSNFATQPEVNCLHGGDYDTVTSACNCKEGFTGSYCEHNVCDGLCLNNGTCSVFLSPTDETTATCNCKEGFEGLHCERNICDGFCLNNGTCSFSSSLSDESTATCSCKEGFKGLHCEHDICDGFCLNNGTCSVSSSLSDESTATCSCKEGFNGRHCEHNICEGFCVNNGTCSVSSNVSNIPTAMCSCKEGFEGLHCERNICDGFCLNNGTCSVSSNVSNIPTATCNCKEGFNGLHCEHNICEGFCLNNGTCSVSSNISNIPTAMCSCREGFNGLHCEHNICDGFCLNNGTCSVSLNVSNIPTTMCSCREGFNGLHCEHNICDGFCLNNGTCSVSSNGEPSCKCGNFRGLQCEFPTELDKLCVPYCMGTDNVLDSSISTFCRCDKLMESIPEDIPQDIEPSTSSTIILSVLIAVIVILIIVVGVLSYHVHKLRRRPRIRKRFLVSKGGVTPLTSRPQVSADNCEITIENCCNMNICETPCFEPKLRTPPTKTKDTKREEKNSLLDTMEGADSC